VTASLVIIPAVSSTRQTGRSLESGVWSREFGVRSQTPDSGLPTPDSRLRTPDSLLLIRYFQYCKFSS
jgi:hypothetical protein